MYYQVYRMEGEQKVIIGYASHATQAMLILQEERKKIDDELQIGIEEVKEGSDHELPDQ